MAKRVALVTGGTGFVGRHLCREAAKFASVVVAAKAEENPTEGISLEIADPNSADILIRSTHPDIVFHLAGRITGTTAELYETNARGTNNVLAAILRHCPEARVVCVGSSAEYGYISAERQPVDESAVCAPVSDYGWSKLAATSTALMYHHLHGLDVVVARPFNIIGPGVSRDVVLGALLARISAARKNASNDIIPVGNTSARRDFVDVRDVARALVALGTCETSTERIYNICSGVLTPLTSIVEWLEARSKRRLAHDPALSREKEVSELCGANSRLRMLGVALPSYSLVETLEGAWIEGIEGEA